MVIQLLLIIGIVLAIFCGLVYQPDGWRAGLALFVALVLYVVPSLIATARRHRDENAIAALNLLLGWTFLGWFGALIWSLTGNVRPKPENKEKVET